MFTPGDTLGWIGGFLGKMIIPFIILMVLDQTGALDWILKQVKGLMDNH